jgi:hypothetical protein
MDDLKALRDDIESAFRLGDEHARADWLLELIDKLGLAAPEPSPALDALLAGLRNERSSRVLATAWGRLAREPHPVVRAFADRQVDDADSVHRPYAISYIGRAYPADRRALFNRVSRESDPSILFEAGFLIADEDPRLAVETWYRAMDHAPMGMADEVLPMLIGQYADEAFVEKLRQDAKNPLDHLARLALGQAEMWNAIEYLDAREPVRRGRGYVVPCPLCGTTIGIYNGHEGERARCKTCNGEFIIPPPPP